MNKQRLRIHVIILGAFWLCVTPALTSCKEEKATGNNNPYTCSIFFLSNLYKGNIKRASHVLQRTPKMQLITECLEKYYTSLSIQEKEILKKTSFIFKESAIRKENESDTYIISVEAQTPYQKGRQDIKRPLCVVVEKKGEYFVVNWQASSIDPFECQEVR